jgi:LysM repeat protein
VFVALTVGFVSGRAAAGQARPAPAKVYVVHPGETLWGIAARLAGPTADPRPVVDRLVSANHLSGSTIIPGQSLVLPPP